MLSSFSNTLISDHTVHKIVHILVELAFIIELLYFDRWKIVNDYENMSRKANSITTKYKYRE